MNELKYTLIADGSSDKTLLRIIKWLLDDLYPKLPNAGSFADFRLITDPPKKLSDKVAMARYYFPYDVLFVHRDSESIRAGAINKRIKEIKKEIGEEQFQQTICIIPVKMMETWLLIDAEAIRKAAGNRNYRGAINLPPLKKLEKENQPKNVLHTLLQNASGLKGRNLKKFNIDKAVHLVAENTGDFSPLRSLPAFQAFEKNMTEVMKNYSGE